jgi:hypothetical protein
MQWWEPFTFAFDLLFKMLQNPIIGGFVVFSIVLTLMERYLKRRKRRRKPQNK